MGKGTTSRRPSNPCNWARLALCVKFPWARVAVTLSLQSGIIHFIIICFVGY